ncbi:MAG: acyl carrier protein [Bacteroidales bacterium]|jgi:acyl carrier protein
MEKFIKNFANQFDDTEISEFKPETNFRDLEEWSSLTALAVLNMIEKKYNIIIKADEMKKANTIQELFDLLQLKIK